MIRVAIPIIVLLLLISSVAITFPRMSLEYNIECSNCHINPSGGGMRTEFGNYSVALNEFCLPQTKDKFIKLYHSPKISDGVTVGFDTRHLILDNGRVFRMQTDAYFNFEPFKDFNYQLRFWENGIIENYALFFINNKKYFIKVGHFYPAYGLKNVDHKSFNRERTGHGSNVYLDGISTGFSLNGYNLHAEILDNFDQALFGLHLFKTTSLDQVGLMLGGSLRLTEEIDGSNRGFPESRAIFGGISFDRFSLMGERDYTGKGSDTLITYLNLTTRLEYGLYLIGEYNYFDGDRNSGNEVDEFIRLSVELYPIPFFQLRPSYTIYTDGFMNGETDFFLLVHFGY